MNEPAPPEANRLERFRKHRERMNERILELDHRGVNRFFNLETLDLLRANLRDGQPDTR